MIIVNFLDYVWKVYSTCSTWSIHHFIIRVIEIISLIRFTHRLNALLLNLFFHLSIAVLGAPCFWLAADWSREGNGRRIDDRSLRWGAFFLHRFRLPMKDITQGNTTWKKYLWCEATLTVVIPNPSPFSSRIDLTDRHTCFIDKTFPSRILTHL